MDNEKLKPGDVVVLKSGGPGMTISDIVGENECHCVWFTPEEKLKGRTFVMSSLEKLEEEIG